jgi:predicted  nucleic acid-binding Zn-ribbon protein
VIFFEYNQNMSAALGLLRLQQVDSHISQIEARLGKIQEILENDSEIQEVLGKIRTAETKQRDFEHARHTAEEQAHDQQIKINQAEANLYGGSVHNPKELLDLQADILYLKKHLAATEDQELDAMLQVEATQKELMDLREDLKRVQSRLSDEHKTLILEQETLSRDLANLQTERQAAIDPVEADFLKTYETIRQQRRGMAVAEVSENACRACGTTLTAALQQSARHAVNLVFCPSCGRILYAG